MAQRVESFRVGADVDSRYVELAWYGYRRTERIDNDARAIRAWLRRQSAPVSLAVEATGRYHQTLVELAHAQGLRVYLLNPQRLHHYRHSVGGRAKTDRCDARLLARYLAHEHSELRAWTPPPKGQRAAWALLKRHAKLVQVRQVLQQSFADAPAGMGRELRAVQKRLQRLERVLEQRLWSQMRALGWASALRCCQSIYGVGPWSAAALVIAFHRGDFRSTDAFVAFLGLDVRVRQSGRYVGQQRLTKQGDAEYRRLLHNAAMAGARGDFRPYYQRLRERGMTSTQAYVALARKLARIAFSLMKNETLYDTSRCQTA